MNGVVKLNEAEVAAPFPGLYGGQGVVGLSRFAFDGAPWPANLVVYRLPPGASEGVHSHGPGAAENGHFDEYYYVVEGRGEMVLEHGAVPLEPGDCVRAPPGVAHGVRNPQSEGDLRILLIFIVR